MRFFTFLAQTATHTTKHYAGYFSALIAAVITLLLGTALATLIALVSRAIFAYFNISLAQFFLLQGAYAVVGMLLMFVVVTFLGGVVVLSALTTDGTTKNLKALIPHFTSFLFLTILLVIGSMIAKAPIHGMASLMLTRNDNALFSILLLIMSAVMHIGLILFASIAPFLMLDTGQHLKPTIVKTYAMIKKNIAFLIKRILGAFIILFLIHFGIISTRSEELVTVWILCMVLFFAPFMVSYFALTYKELK